ncbi:MAG: hypothetical protein K0Q50_192 [Vampirovibrio sp.]|jgi:plasmid maintenance system antidote protein VapI|nr:hypothetical protein [Vampirovibrio sp.]
MSFIDFGKAVEARLNEIGLTPAEAAKRMGVSKNYVKRIINTNVKDIKASYLYKLARVLQWDPMQMHRAFHGKDPYDTKEQERREATREAYKEFMERLTSIGFEDDL